MNVELDKGTEAAVKANVVPGLFDLLPGHVKVADAGFRFLAVEGSRLAHFNGVVELVYLRPETFHDGQTGRIVGSPIDAPALRATFQSLEQRLRGVLRLPLGKQGRVSLVDPQSHESNSPRGGLRSLPLIKAAMNREILQDFTPFIN